jgi:hypothetical protein
MKTRVTFEGVCDRKVITKTITISHPDFEEIYRDGLNISNKTAFGTLNAIEKILKHGTHTEKTRLGFES